MGWSHIQILLVLLAAVCLPTLTLTQAFTDPDPGEIFFRDQDHGVLSGSGSGHHSHSLDYPAETEVILPPPAQAQASEEDIEDNDRGGDRGRRVKRTFDLNELIYTFLGGFTGGPYNPYGQRYGYYGGNPLLAKLGGTGGLGGPYNYRYRYYGLNPGYYNTLFATRGYGFHTR